MKKKGEGSSSSAGDKAKPERKTIEKNRRIQMKCLCFKLVSLIPDSHFSSPKEYLSQQDQLEQAAGYIRVLSERVEELRRRKTLALTGSSPKNHACTNGGVVEGTSSELPILKITDYGPNLEVVLITGAWKNFMAHEVIVILEEEGANVVSVNLSKNGSKFVHTFHSQIKLSRVGVDTSRLCQRIQELIS